MTALLRIDASDLPWTRALVEARLVEAVETLSLLPDREYGWIYRTRVMWPEIVRSYEEGYGYGEATARPSPPSAAAIDRLLPTLDWLRWLGREDGSLVLHAAASLVNVERRLWSRKRWGHIKRRGRIHGREVDLELRYKAALSSIATRLNCAGVNVR